MALGTLGIGAPAVAALWQAREIFRAIGDEASHLSLEPFLEETRQRLGKKGWKELLVTLGADAEKLRLQGVEGVRKSAAPRPGNPPNTT